MKSANRSANLILAVEPFDLLMILCIVGLIAAIGFVVLRGDQVGLGVLYFGPTESASSRATIQITFDEPIQAISKVESYFSLTPPIKGRILVINKQIIFQPAETLQLEQTYTVTIRAGLTSSNGRKLKADVHWQFRIRVPQIVYLVADTNSVANLYTLNPPRQLTNSDAGINSYDVAPDGSKIVYSETPIDGSSRLYLLDAATGQSTLLYKCQDAICSHLTWRPDGGMIAFERADLNSGTGTEGGLARVWLFDVAMNEAHPLFRDNQQLGVSPHWSPDSTRLAIYNAAVAGIEIHDFTNGKDTIIPAEDGEVGEFSPDGRWLSFPKIVQIGEKFVIHLALLDLSSAQPTQRDLVPDSDAYNDVEGAWRSDSRSLIVARHQPYEGGSQPPQPQLYDIEIATGKMTPLVTDKNYKNTRISLSPIGDRIVFERFASDKPDAQTEIWLYQLDTKSLTLLATNGFDPRWIP